jgi:polynucleotide 5'-hydroxyl-kinase GRC3/NOL9
VTHLAGELARRGLSVAVVDADVGQSEIGPPATVGLGRIVRPVSRLAEAELIALHFVGSTSPAREMTATVTGTARLVGEARRLDFDRILVDTSGLVGGDIGRALKRRKIDAVQPDLVVALERAGECEHILAAYASRQHPRVLRLPALAAPRRRSDADRRRHRATAFTGYLAPARRRELDLSQVALRNVRGVPVAGESALVGTLVGLENASGQTIGVGFITGADAAAARLTVHTAATEEAIAAVIVGRERFAG